MMINANSNILDFCLDEMDKTCMAKCPAFAECGELYKNKGRRTMNDGRRQASTSITQLVKTVAKEEVDISRFQR